VRSDEDLFAAFSQKLGDPNAGDPNCGTNTSTDLGQRKIVAGDDEWPGCLSEIGSLDPPEQLFVKGRRLEVDSQTIAVVGTRRPTTAGVEATQRLVEGLVQAGFTIVSGLAVGIDAVAHRTALDCGGYTIAVLGSGLDSRYPARNRALKKAIFERGTVVTEYPNGTEPLPFNFPRRNRIVVGLSKGVLVVEGGFRSGALITARIGIDANRHVWAVPGSIRNRLSEGPHELIRTGQAGLVTDVKHIFEDISPSLVWEDGRAAKPLAIESLTSDEKVVLQLLDDVPVPPDRIRKLSNLKSGVVALALSRLEVRGFALKRLAGYEITTSGARARVAIENLAD
jgi:DNA processing protein